MSILDSELYRSLFYMGADSKGKKRMKSPTQKTVLVFLQELRIGLCIIQDGLYLVIQGLDE